VTAFRGRGHESVTAFRRLELRPAVGVQQTSGRPGAARFHSSCSPGSTPPTGRLQAFKEAESRLNSARRRIPLRHAAEHISSMPRALMSLAAALQTGQYWLPLGGPSPQVGPKLCKLSQVAGPERGLVPTAAAAAAGEALSGLSQA
jgi:hypothetical protein